MHPAVAQSLLVRRPAPLKTFLVASIVAHGALLVLGLGYQYFTGGPSLPLDQPAIKASLVRLGKPRDEKLLPRKEEELPPPPQKSEGSTAPTQAPAPPDKAIAVPIPGVKPEPESKTQKQAGADKGTDNRRKLFDAFSKKSKATKVEELEGALDGDPLGDSATGEGERYFALITTQIRRHYNVSDTIPEQERMYLKATVRIQINRSGEITRIDIAKSSGNALFDSAVKTAAQRASPVSPPPDHLRDPLARTGIPIVFTP